MNALYTHALRQTQSITQDLAVLESSVRAATNGGSDASPYDSRSASPARSLQGNGVDTAGLNGQIVASLAALQRTVDDYESMARKELVEANKVKAATRVERVKNDYSGLRKKYEQIKQQQASQKLSSERAALFSTGGNSEVSGSGMQQRRVPQSPSLGNNESPFSLPARTSSTPTYSGRGATRPLYAPRTNAALDEHSFINDTGSQLDSFIAQGQAVLGNLSGQRDMLKGKLPDL
ncbi:protein transport protein bos1 [Cystobasidiomycetes sp. EMM_F5]